MDIYEYAILPYLGNKSPLLSLLLLDNLYAVFSTRACLPQLEKSGRDVGLQ